MRARIAAAADLPARTLHYEILIARTKESLECFHGALDDCEAD